MLYVNSILHRYIYEDFQKLPSQEKNGLSFERPPKVASVGKLILDL